ncbi:WHG domain-containing protein [Streptomyces iakyrus]|uniref:WHG domain-containing protein n=1 Tax=Streptomyces iakyrus TaxID=68219 RepID=UPI0038057B0D
MAALPGGAARAAVSGGGARDVVPQARVLLREARVSVMALTFWTRLHGVLSPELAGHLTGMGFDPAQLFAAEADALTGPSPV